MASQVFPECFKLVLGQRNDRDEGVTENRLHPSGQYPFREGGLRRPCRFPSSPQTETPRSTAGSPARAPLQPPGRADLYDLHPCPQPRADRGTQSRRRPLTGAGEFYADPYKTP